MRSHNNYPCRVAYRLEEAPDIANPPQSPSDANAGRVATDPDRTNSAGIARSTWLIGFWHPTRNFAVESPWTTISALKSRQQRSLASYREVPSQRADRVFGQYGGMARRTAWILRGDAA